LGKKMEIKKIIFLLFTIYHLPFTIYRVYAVPSPVTNLSALTGSEEGAVELNWTYPYEGNLLEGSSYFIQYSTFSEVEWSTQSAQIQISTNVASGFSQTYIVTGLSLGKEHYFRIWVSSLTDGFSDISNGATAYSKLNPPSNFDGVAISSTIIKWSWNWKPLFEGNYIVKQATSGVGLSGPLSVNTTEWAENNLSPNTSCYNYVEAYIGSISATSTAKIKWTLSNPATGLYFTALTSYSVNVCWFANNNSEFTEYEISISTDNFVLNFSTPVSLTTSLSALCSSLSADTTYWFRIRAFNGDNIPAEFSSIVSTKTLDLTPPSSIHDLFASTGPTEGMIVLNWTSPGDNGNNDNLTGKFRIDYSTDENKSWNYTEYKIEITTVNCSPSTVFSKTITGLVSGSTYYFRIWTADEIPNWSEISNGATAYGQVDVSPPGPVTSIIVSCGFRHVQLKWTAPYEDNNSDPYNKGVSTLTYEIRYSSARITNDSLWNQATSFIVIVGSITFPGNIETVIVTGLVNNTTYYFSIKSADENGLWSVISSSSPSGVPFNAQPAQFDTVAHIGPDYYSLKGDNTSVVSKTFVIGSSWSVPSNPGSDDANYGDYISSYTLVFVGGGSSITISGISTTTYTQDYTGLLQENVTYFWYVDAYDSESAIRRSRDWIFHRTIAINTQNSPPTSFNLIISSGIQSYPGANTNITLDWQDAIDPDPGDFISEYKIYWSTSPDVSYTNFTGSYTVTESTFTIRWGLTENATHWWFVVAYDSGAPFGYEVKYTSSPKWWFQVNGINDPVSQFDLTSPETGVILYTRTPQLSWQKPYDPDEEFGGTISYTVYYSSYLTSPGPTYSPFNFEGGESSQTVNTYVILPQLVENATYFWRVTAMDNLPGFSIVNESSSTAVRLFIVNATSEPPNSFNLISTSGSIRDLRPTCIWQNNGDPDPYDYVGYWKLYYSTSPNFETSITSFTENLTQNSWTFPYDLKPRTTYYWNVRAYGHNEQGTTYRVANTTFSFCIKNQKPNSFDLISPTGGAIVETNYPVFEWENKGDPDGDTLTYTIYYSSKSDFSVTYSSGGWKTNQIISPTYLEENATYWWFIEASDGYDSVFSQSTGVFRVNGLKEPPLPFELLYPTNTYVVNTSTPEFSWNKPVDPDPGDEISSYTIFYSSDNFITTYSSAGLKNTKFVPGSQLIENATYFWYVRAYDSTGYSRASMSTFYFIIDAVNDPPDDFNLISPVNGSSVCYNVKFEWQKANRTEFWEMHTYNLYYGKVGASAETVVTGITNNWYTVNFSPEIENTEIWWKVEAVDSKTPQPNKKFSKQTWHIFISSTNEPPEWPSDISSYISPADGSSIISRTPEFSWPSAKDPDELAGDKIVSYTLKYSTVPDLSIAVKEISLTGTSYKIPSTEKLLQNTTYYWQVRAYDSGGLWTPTSIYRFYIPVLLKLKPPDYFVRRELKDAGKKFYFEWTQVTEYEDGTPAVYYDIGSNLEKQDINGYNIYKSNRPDGEYSLIGFAPLYSESWTDDLTDSKTYYYFVRAVSLTGVESDISPIVSSSSEPQIIFMSQKKDAYVSVSDYVNNLFRTQKKKILVSREFNECEVKVLNNETNTEIKNYKFSEPVILSFVYPISNRSSTLAGNSNRTPVIFWHNGVEYIKLGGSLDTTNERVYVHISNTGKYKLQNISDKDFSFDIYPRKIFTPNQDGINDEIKFNFINNTGEQVSGEIYDLSGAFVKKMEIKSDQGDYLVWDGKTESGSYSHKGIYIYQIKVGNKVYTGTIILAR